MMWISIDFRKGERRTRTCALMRGGGDIMVLCGELLVAVSVLTCGLVVVRGGRARPWCVGPVVVSFLDVCAGAAPRGVRFPSHGIGLVSARRRTRCPPRRRGRPTARAGRASSCPASRRSPGARRRASVMMQAPRRRTRRAAPSAPDTRSDPMPIALERRRRHKLPGGASAPSRRNRTKISV